MSDANGQYTSILDVPWFGVVAQKADEYLSTLHSSEISPWYIRTKRHRLVTEVADE